MKGKKRNSLSTKSGSKKGTKSESKKGTKSESKKGTKSESKKDTKSESEKGIKSENKECAKSENKECAKSESEKCTKSESEAQPCNLSEILPQKVGMTTVINEMEVTMTQGNSEGTVPKKSKKKKKKKNAAEETPADSVEEPQNNVENSPNLLNFSEVGGIRLVNHPDISVTVSAIPQETKPDVTNGTGQNNVETSTDTATGTTKKKKKRKKKNSQTDTTPAPADPESTAPTYVKLPATGDTCVLVVSHESFANGGASDKAKMSNNNNSKSQAESNKTVTIKNTNFVNPSTLFPISIGNMMNNTAKPPLPMENIPCSISLTPIPNTIATPALNANEENASQPTKAQLKAERRALQEAQRAAKEAKKAEKGASEKPSSTSTVTVSEVKASSNSKVTLKSDLKPVKSDPKPVKSDPKPVKSDPKPVKSDHKTCKDTSKLVNGKDQPHQVRLFSHLPPYKTLENLLKQISKAGTQIHPAILEIGTQFSRGIVCGSNARCIALLAAMKEVINDHVPLVNKNFLKDLDVKIQSYMSFLQNCRPLSVSMINAMKFLRRKINNMDKELSDSDVKTKLCDLINEFVREEILLAKEQIRICAADKIVNGDVILVFAYSSLVKEVLFTAFNQNKKFQVVIVDSRPKMEALKMVNCLVEKGISCSYTLINSISYVMKDVSKVIIGAHALLSNGYVMSRMGCSQIALVAAAYSVPVLVCCETYKFWERVLTDSFVHNELGHPKVLVNTGQKNNILSNWQALPTLQLLNLLYDVTPPDLISVVITEKGVLPCTSVPVVLRVRHAGLHE